jgi:hypothetical protein
MAKQIVGIGTVANDGTGDTLRDGADKINDNFDEVYATLGDGTTLTNGPQLSYETTGDTGSSAYRFSGPGVGSGNNPAFTVYRGHTYIFDNSVNYPSHPLEIRVSNGGAAFTEGVSQLTGNAGEIVKFVVPHEPSDTALVYQCTVHAAMVGDITIV